MSEVQVPTPVTDHPSLYDEYEVRTRDGEVCFKGPLWAAMLYLRLEVCQVRRLLIPTGKGRA